MAGHKKTVIFEKRYGADIKEIERQTSWTTQPQLGAPSAAMYQRRVDYLRLLRQVLPITEISHLDAEGKEQLRVSRLAMDVAGSGIDYSREPKFLEAKAGKIYHGPVYFRKESEPYMTIAMAGSGKEAGVTVAEGAAIGDECVYVESGSGTVETRVSYHAVYPVLNVTVFRSVSTSSALWPRLKSLTCGSIARTNDSMPPLSG